MISVLDLARELLGHPRQGRHDQYRLIRPRFRLTCDAYDWLMSHRGDDGTRTWRQPHDSDDGRRTAMYAWIALRKAHRVAWLERGGGE